MTPGELTAFAKKVEAWGRSLTPREQEFLVELIARAATAEPADVHGYAFDALIKDETSETGRRPDGPITQPGTLPKWEGLATSFIKIAGH